MRRITEIVERMRQGLCEPFLCRADDGRLYVVKSRSAGKTSLVKEWVAGRIAQAAGLPIPPIEMVDFDPHQVRFTADPEAQNLAECPGFASRFVEQAVDFLPALVREVAPELRRKVAWFDWWIANGDRNDGNTNLMWVAHEKRLHTIDHNNAFDNPDGIGDFWDHHVFRADRAFPDGQEIRQLFSDIIDQLPAIWSEMPEEWIDGCLFSEQQADTILRRCLSDEFWITQ